MTPSCVWKICVSVCVSLNFATTAVVRNTSLFPLDIIHYNDFHARFEETSVQFPICSTNDTNCIGGFPRLYHEIRTLLREKPHALLLNAGDSFQGTYWYTLLKWNVTQHFMNMLPHDAHTLGNHEFDNGVEGLAPYLAALRAPVIVANIDTSQEPSLEGLYKPRIVVERRGRKIGIIGIITPDTQQSSYTGKVKFTDPAKAVSEQAQILTDEGVNIIIVLSHCGIDVDAKIAKNAGKYVDIIVGGHTHSLLWNEKPAPSKEYVTGPYPVIVESNDKHGHLVLVVTAAAFSKYLGNITAYFNDEGDLMTFNGDPIFLNRSIPEDPEIKALMQPYTEKLHKMMHEAVGEAAEVLDDKPCGRGECKLGNLVADAYLATSNKYQPSNLTSLAFLTRNMIRGAVTKGDITRGDIINIQPFGNVIVTYTIKGKYIIDALELSFSNAWTTKPFSGPWVPQIAGMQARVNITSHTVVSVLVGRGDTLLPLEMERDYQLITPDFLALSGSFKMLKDNYQDMKSVGVDFQLIEEYIGMTSLVTPQLDNRLELVE